MRKITAILCTLAAVLVLQAQDHHYSQYWGSPLQLNPALAGVFNESVRLNAHYRNQWFAESTSFATYAVAVDGNIGREQMKGNFLGIGAAFYQDVQDQGSFKNTGGSLSLSYNQRMGSRGKYHYIGLGLQPGFISKQVNLNNLIYGRLFEVNDNSDPIDLLNYQNRFIFDFGAGLSYFANIQNKHNFGAGFAVGHIGQPAVGFRNNTEDILYRKFTANASGKIQLNNKVLSVLPTMLFHKQGPHQQINFGSYVGFMIDERSNTALYVGAMYRMSGYETSTFGSDAFIGGVRLEVQTLDIGFAYDITTSDLRRVASFMGGPELYVIYTIPTSKSYRERLNCPKF
jgi:type IX secretion system PorP/SprF family membrane protein